MNSSIDNFTFITPDEDSYNFGLLPFADWYDQVKYVKFTDSIGYWQAPHPFMHNSDYERFKKAIKCYPVCKTNNHNKCLDPNPFATIHVPGWLSDPLCAYVKELYLNNTNIDVATEVYQEWGNLYWPHICKPIRIFRMPHIDSQYGMVSNLWFEGDAPGYGTQLYEYKGKIINGVYDFMSDDSHKLHKWWKEENKTDRLNFWRNFSDEAAEELGFECVGIAPAISNTMTLYLNNVPHTPYISKDNKFRWSHTFSYSHTIPFVQKLSDL